MFSGTFLDIVAYGKLLLLCLKFVKKFYTYLCNLFGEKEGPPVEFPVGEDQRREWLFDKISKGFIRDEIREKINKYQIELVRVNQLTNKLGLGYKLIFYRENQKISPYFFVRNKSISKIGKAIQMASIESI